MYIKNPQILALLFFLLLGSACSKKPENCNNFNGKRAACQEYVKYCEFLANLAAKNDNDGLCLSLNRTAKTCLDIPLKYCEVPNYIAGITCDLVDNDCQTAQMGNDAKALMLGLKELAQKNDQASFDAGLKKVSTQYNELNAAQKKEFYKLYEGKSALHYLLAAKSKIDSKLAGFAKNLMNNLDARDLPKLLQSKSLIDLQTPLEVLLDRNVASDDAMEVLALKIYMLEKGDNPNMLNLADLATILFRANPQSISNIYDKINDATRSAFAGLITTSEQKNIFDRILLNLSDDQKIEFRSEIIDKAAKIAKQAAKQAPNVAANRAVQRLVRVIGWVGINDQFKKGNLLSQLSSALSGPDFGDPKVMELLEIVKAPVFNKAQASAIDWNEYAGPAVTIVQSNQGFTNQVLAQRLLQVHKPYTALQLAIRNGDLNIRDTFDNTTPGLSDEEIRQFLVEDLDPTRPGINPIIGLAMLKATNDIKDIFEWVVMQSFRLGLDDYVNSSALIPAPTGAVLKVLQILASNGYTRSAPENSHSRSAMIIMSMNTGARMDDLSANHADLLDLIIDPPLNSQHSHALIQAFNTMPVGIAKEVSEWAFTNRAIEGVKEAFAAMYRRPDNEVAVLAKREMRSVLLSKFYDADLVPELINNSDAWGLKAGLLSDDYKLRNYRSAFFRRDEGYFVGKLMNVFAARDADEKFSRGIANIIAVVDALRPLASTVYWESLCEPGAPARYDEISNTGAIASNTIMSKLKDAVGTDARAKALLLCGVNAAVVNEEARYSRDRDRKNSAYLARLFKHFKVLNPANLDALADDNGRSFVLNLAYLEPTDDTLGILKEFLASLSDPLLKKAAIRGTWITTPLNILALSSIDFNPKRAEMIRLLIAEGADDEISTIDDEQHLNIVFDAIKDDQALLSRAFKNIRKSSSYREALVKWAYDNRDPIVKASFKDTLATTDKKTKTSIISKLIKHALSEKELPTLIVESDDWGFKDRIIADVRADDLPSMLDALKDSPDILKASFRTINKKSTREAATKWVYENRADPNVLKAWSLMYQSIKTKKEIRSYLLTEYYNAELLKKGSLKEFINSSHDLGLLAGLIKDNYKLGTDQGVFMKVVARALSNDGKQDHIEDVVDVLYPLIVNGDPDKQAEWDRRICSPNILRNLALKPERVKAQLLCFVDANAVNQEAENVRVIGDNNTHYLERLFSSYQDFDKLAEATSNEGFGFAQNLAFLTTTAQTESMLTSYLNGLRNYIAVREAIRGVHGLPSTLKILSDHKKRSSADNPLSKDNMIKELLIRGANDEINTIDDVGDLKNILLVIKNEKALFKKVFKNSKEDLYSVWAEFVYQEDKNGNELPKNLLKEVVKDQVTKKASLLEKLLLFVNNNYPPTELDEFKKDILSWGFNVNELNLALNAIGMATIDKNSIIQNNTYINDFTVLKKFINYAPVSEKISAADFGNLNNIKIEFEKILVDIDTNERSLLSSLYLNRLDDDLIYYYVQWALEDYSDPYSIKSIMDSNEPSATDEVKNRLKDLVYEVAFQEDIEWLVKTFNPDDIIDDYQSSRTAKITLNNGNDYGLIFNNRDKYFELNGKKGPLVWKLLKMVNNYIDTNGGQWEFIDKKGISVEKKEHFRNFVKMASFSLSRIINSKNGWNNYTTLKGADKLSAIELMYNVNNPLYDDDISAKSSIEWQ